MKRNILGMDDTSTLAIEIKVPVAGYGYPYVIVNGEIVYLGKTFCDAVNFVENFLL